MIMIIVIVLDEMHSSAVLSLFGFFFVKLQLELVRVRRGTSRHRHRRHPSRRGLAQIDRLRAGDRYSWSYSYDKLERRNKDSRQSSSRKHVQKRVEFAQRALFVSVVFLFRGMFMGDQR